MANEQIPTLVTRPPPASNLHLLEADTEHLPSLESIHSRAFHPTNAFQRRVMPLTLAMRQWWNEVHAQEISNQNSRGIIVVDSTPADPEKAVVGCLWARLMGPEEKGCGVWDEVPLTTDHDAEAYQEMLKPTKEWREKLCWGRRHYCTIFFLYVLE